MFMTLPIANRRNRNLKKTQKIKTVFIDTKTPGDVFTTLFFFVTSKWVNCIRAGLFCLV